MVKKFILVIVMIVTTLVFQACATSETTTTATQTSDTTTSAAPLEYLNPVFEPVLADPAIIQDDDGYYYVFGTQDYGQWGDTFGTKYIPILKSLDLVNWEFASSVFTLATAPIWGTPNAGLWAPDIVKINDTYNLYYSMSTWGDPNPGIGVATASHPLGPWTDHGKLFDSNSIGVNNSIDPAVYVDEDESVWIVWGSFRGIYIAELTSDGLSLKDGSNAINTKIRIAGYDTSTSWNGSTYEGAYVIQREGFYYLFLSSGSCCDGHTSSYNVKVGRSTSITGPYYDDLERTMLAGNRGYQVLMGSSYFAGPGHNSIVTDKNGDDWIVYHAYNLAEPPMLGNTPRRSLMIDKLVWNDEGWPSVFGKMPSNRSTEAPNT